MLTGESGFIYNFSRNGHIDEDFLTEFFFALGDVHGISVSESEDTLTYSLTLDNESHPLMIFSSQTCDCRTDQQALSEFLSYHARFPFEADDFFNDVNSDGHFVPMPLTYEDADKIVLATYRLIHDLNYHD